MPADHKAYRPVRGLNGVRDGDDMAISVSDGDGSLSDVDISQKGLGDGAGPEDLGPEDLGPEDLGPTQQAGWCAPFRYRDYQLLFATNVCEFIGSTLAEMGILVWLYEETGSALSLGMLGVISLCVQVPMIPLGGVLADELNRKTLVSTMQATAAISTLVVALLSASGALRVWIVYITAGVLQVTARLEGSARGALAAATVPEAALARAVSLNVITSDAGECLAPILFFAVAGGAQSAPSGSLTHAFLGAAVAYAVAAVTPLLMSASGRPGDVKDGPMGDNEPRERATLRSRLAALVEGFHYIAGHKLLPGLYALDWGMTVVSFYRELFPLFVAKLFTQGYRELGLSARGAVAVLTSCNYFGGVVGGLVTFRVQDCDNHYGRHVLFATILYGGGCVFFGATNSFLLGACAVFLCGAFDAVGAAMRGTVVMLTTPDRMRGRAQSGHSLAANAANSIGQLYVAAMASAIGAGPTMLLGGFITWVATGAALAKIPALWTYKYTPDAEDEVKGALDASDSAEEDRQGSEIGDDGLLDDIQDEKIGIEMRPLRTDAIEVTPRHSVSDDER